MRRAVDALNHEMGTDRPILVQYTDWVRRFVTGDMGRSYAYRAPVAPFLKTALINSGKLFADIGLASLDPAHDRVMICGSPALVTDTRALLNGKGFVEGNHGEPAQFVVEKAFAER